MKGATKGVMTAMEGATLMMTKMIDVVCVCVCHRVIIYRVAPLDLSQWYLVVSRPAAAMPYPARANPGCRPG